MLHFPEKLKLSNHTSECDQWCFYYLKWVIIGDVISYYKLPNFRHILMVSWRVVSRQSSPLTTHSMPNLRDISVTMTVFQSYIQELEQGIHVKIVSHKLRYNDSLSTCRKKMPSVNVPKVTKQLVWYSYFSCSSGGETDTEMLCILHLINSFIQMSWFHHFIILTQQSCLVIYTVLCWTVSVC